MVAPRTSVPCVSVRPRGAGGSTVRAGLLTLLLALLVGGRPSQIGAQEQLVGIVTDRPTAAPLVGVYVTLEREDEALRRRLGTTAPVDAALTNQSGRFVLSAEAGGTYRLVAERVGLATEVSEWFTLESPAALRRITMVERAVRIEGFHVTGGVRTCRLEPADATLVHRWWSEVSKALRTAAFVNTTDLVGLSFEGFEREWTADLRSVGSERYRTLPSTPFRALQDAEELSELGFVRGEPGERLFLGPDAAVLFSEAFLADHCFGIADEGDDELTATEARPGELRLAVEPTRTSPADIRGVLTVDTLTGELRSFDFRYANLPPDIAWSRAGGHLTFEYLAAGAWIVSDWWLRIPRIGLQRGLWGMVPWVIGYVDRGGRALEIGGRAAALDQRVGGGTLQGMVYDSLTRGPLAGARVSIVGSRLSTRTGPDGRFTLADVPAGRHGLTFHHSDLTRIGLPSPVVPVDVVEGTRDTVALATPGFAAATVWFCEDAAGSTAAILAGRVVTSEDAQPAPLAEVRATWVAPPDASGAIRSGWIEQRSGSDGRYAFCGLPPDLPVNLTVRTDSTAWRKAGTVELPRGVLVAKELRPGAGAPAVVWGTVRAEEDGAPLAGADVWLLAVEGDTVASARVDTAGVFRMSVPAGAGYRAFAAGESHVQQHTTTFTLASAQSLDLHFELVTSPKIDAMEIKGVLVEVETRNRAMARRLLGLYGQTPESLGRRWIDRAAIDALRTSGDPGVAIQRKAMPGVWVPEGMKWGHDAKLCVTHLSRNGCAITVLNGVRIGLDAALTINFHDLEAIAVLDPLEATTFFGTEGGGGAVLMWTRAGR